MAVRSFRIDESRAEDRLRTDGKRHAGKRRGKTRRWRKLIPTTIPASCDGKKLPFEFLSPTVTSNFIVLAGPVNRRLATEASFFFRSIGLIKSNVIKRREREKSIGFEADALTKLLPEQRKKAKRTMLRARSSEERARLKLDRSSTRTRFLF